MNGATISIGQRVMISRYQASANDIASRLATVMRVDPTHSGMCSVTVKLDTPHHRKGADWAFAPSDLEPCAETADIDEAAQRIVRDDVRYCVSSLIYGLAQTISNLSLDDQQSLLIDDDDIMNLCRRQPDADDYREAAEYDDAIEDRLEVRASEYDPSRFQWVRTDPADSEASPDDFDSAVDAWREIFNLVGADHPDGGEVYEHWLVTDWLADKLEAQGETVARDIAGLTVWGRCTTGQAIYADAVIQRIARDMLEA